MRDVLSGIDTSFKGKWIGRTTPLNDEQAEYKAKLCRLINEKTPWCLVVSGEKGNGKSFFAQIAVNTFNDNGYKGGIYTTLPEIAAEVRSDEMGSGYVYRKYTRVKFLVIDEMSDRPRDWTEAVKTVVESILIELHRLNIIVLLIGNVSLQRMVAMFDERVRDRLQEGTLQIMNEPSLRVPNTEG